MFTCTPRLSRCDHPSLPPSLKPSGAGLPLKHRSPTTWPSFGSSLQAVLPRGYPHPQTPLQVSASPPTPAWAPTEPTLPISLLSTLAKACLTSCFPSGCLFPKQACLSRPRVSPTHFTRPGPEQALPKLWRTHPNLRTPKHGVQGEGPGDLGMLVQVPAQPSGSLSFPISKLWWQSGVGRDGPSHHQHIKNMAEEWTSVCLLGSCLGF